MFNLSLSGIQKYILILEKKRKEKKRKEKKRKEKKRKEKKRKEKKRKATIIISS